MNPKANYYQALAKYKEKRKRCWFHTLRNKEAIYTYIYINFWSRYFFKRKSIEINAWEGERGEELFLSSLWQLIASRRVLKRLEESKRRKARTSQFRNWNRRERDTMKTPIGGRPRLNISIGNGSIDEMGWLKNMLGEQILNKKIERTSSTLDSTKSSTVFLANCPRTHFAIKIDYEAISGWKRALETPF